MAAFFDLGVILILIISAGVSFFRGFIREVLTIVGVIGGAFAALMFGGTLKPVMRGWFGIVDGQDAGKLMGAIPYEIVADVTAYAAIFLLVFIILQLASHFFAAAIAAIGLGPVDRTLGVVFGIARGILFLGLLYLPVLITGAVDQYKDEWFKNSKTLFYVEATSKWLKDFLPHTAEEAKATTSDKLKALGVLDSGKEDTPKDAPEKADGPLTPLPDQGKEEGYDQKDRQILDGLIEKQLPDEKKFND